MNPPAERSEGQPIWLPEYFLNPHYRGLLARKRAWGLSARFGSLSVTCVGGVPLAGARVGD